VPEVFNQAVNTNIPKNRAAGVQQPRAKTAFL
jgi:hypothetical protein